MKHFLGVSLLFAGSYASIAHGKPSDTATPFVGHWTRTNVASWMESKPQKIKSFVKIENPTNGKAKITIEINGHHACHAEGTGVVQTTDKMLFSANLPSDTSKPCTIEILRSNNTIELSGATKACQESCGEAASFDGKFALDQLKH